MSSIKKRLSMVLSCLVAILQSGNLPNKAMDADYDQRQEDNYGVAETDDSNDEDKLDEYEDDFDCDDDSDTEYAHDALLLSGGLGGIYVIYRGVKGCIYSPIKNAVKRNRKRKYLLKYATESKKCLLQWGFKENELEEIRDDEGDLGCYVVSCDALLKRLMPNSNVIKEDNIRKRVDIVALQGALTLLCYSMPNGAPDFKKSVEQTADENEKLKHNLDIIKRENNEFVYDPKFEVFFCKMFGPQVLANEKIKLKNDDYKVENLFTTWETTLSNTSSDLLRVVLGIFNYLGRLGPCLTVFNKVNADYDTRWEVRNGLSCKDLVSDMERIRKQKD